MRISATADLLDECVESGREFVSKVYNNSPTKTDNIDLDESKRIYTIPFGQRYWTCGSVWIATASVCVRFGMECVIHMGAKDMCRQAFNVFKMKLSSV